MKARYPLESIFALINTRDRERIWFSAPSRSIFAVLQVYGKTNNSKTPEEGREFILAGLKALTEKNFVESVTQWGDPKCVADVYGLIYDSRPWYVKFRINEDNILEEISFHPPEKAMITIGKIKVPKGGSS